MGWRDYQKTVSKEFMESMELITIEATSLIPLIPFIPASTITEDGGASALHLPEIPKSVLPKVITADSYPPKDWRPEPRAWLTDTGELRIIGVFPGEWPDGGLTPQIIKLTSDNMLLQAKLLKLHCGRYLGPAWDALVEQWEERAAIMQFGGGMTREQAEQEAAKLYRMEAFLPELCQRN